MKKKTFYLDITITDTPLKSDLTVFKYLLYNYIDYRTIVFLKTNNSLLKLNKTYFRRFWYEK